ncbi:MAG: hypothetical protein NT116_06340, partial [Candidatus Parcubacteria bacterium]|nr:hypothetical protein [Candidatus Parcubacteria bacterium]
MEETPISRGQAKMNAIMATLHLIFYFGIALLIWGLALKKSIFWFGLAGVLVGLIISLLFVAPIMGMQKTKERTKELMFSIGSIWGGISIIIGILGILVWIIRAIFF